MIELLALVRLVTAEFKELMLESRVSLWKAPNWPRSEVTWLTASLTIWAAVVGIGRQGRGAVGVEVVKRRHWRRRGWWCPTLWMPRWACWLLPTVGPIWNVAPPPVMLKSMAPAVVGATVMLMARFELSTDRVLPLPVAVTPLIVPATSVPVEVLVVVLPAFWMALSAAPCR